MNLTFVPSATEHRSHLRWAWWLAVFTIVWNVAEGVVALVAAAAANSQALISFGVDSFVESISAGVLLWRLGAERRSPARAADVEQRALRLIGYSFFALAALVAADSVWSLINAQRPSASGIGIALTLVSLIVMPLLARAKRRVGHQLGSRSIEADSQQTQACVYLSAVVLAGLAFNAALGWWWADPVAALAVVGFLLHEGREALHADRVDQCC